MLGFPSEAEVEAIRKKYPVGTKIRVNYMNDPRPIEPGTKGVVDHVDDAGTIHCKFENGRYLGLVPDEDSFDIIKAPNKEREER